MGGTACPSHTKSISLAASLRNPFLADIIDTLLHPTWKGVTLDKYDVTTNLDEHIDNNVVQEGLFIMDDIVLCKFNHMLVIYFQVESTRFPSRVHLLDQGFTFTLFTRYPSQVHLLSHRCTFNFFIRFPS
ncbi:hypothetical protein JHK86_000732 [Glycine max]|nr:hypothetical protein JHK86_000732 [Glycine max]